jgi:surface protein
MKRWMMLMLCCGMLSAALAVGFAHAKYVSTTSLSFNLTLGKEQTSGDTLLPGPELNEVLHGFYGTVSEKSPKRIFFGYYEDYADVVGSWDGENTEPEDSKNTRHNLVMKKVDVGEAGNIRVFYFENSSNAYAGGDYTYFAFILCRRGHTIKMSEDSSSMFSGLYLNSISGLDTDLVDTSDVTDMSSMFQGCMDLLSLDLSGFNTSKVTDMSHMFQACCLLKSLDLRNFDTSAVTDMRSMFYDCKEVGTITLGDDFKIKEDTEISHMFCNCLQLKTIAVSEKWKNNSIKAGEDMFEECWSLRGEDGTYFQKQYIYSEYAIIDGVQGTGYLTLYKDEGASAAELGEEQDNSGKSDTSGGNRKPESSSSGATDPDRADQVTDEPDTSTDDTPDASTEESSTPDSAEDAPSDGTSPSEEASPEEEDP